MSSNLFTFNQYFARVDSRVKIAKSFIGKEPGKVGISPHKSSLSALQFHGRNLINCFYRIKIVELLKNNCNILILILSSPIVCVRCLQFTYKYIIFQLIEYKSMYFSTVFRFEFIKPNTSCRSVLLVFMQIITRFSIFFCFVTNIVDIWYKCIIY